MVFIQYVFQQVQILLPHSSSKERKGLVYMVYIPSCYTLFNMMSSLITDEMELGTCEKVLHEFVSRLCGVGNVGQSVYQGPN